MKTFRLNNATWPQIAAAGAVKIAQTLRTLAEDAEARPAMQEELSQLTLEVLRFERHVDEAVSYASATAQDKCLRRKAQADAAFHWGVAGRIREEIRDKAVSIIGQLDTHHPEAGVAQLHEELHYGLGQLLTAIQAVSAH